MRLYIREVLLRHAGRVADLCLCLSGPVARVLLFNATGERDSAAMLKLLVVSGRSRWG